MVDVVYNLAFPPPDRDREEYQRFTAQSLRNLLEESQEHGVKTFVHLSPLEVYGQGKKSPIDYTTSPSPTNAYQGAKLEAERVVTEYAKQNSSEMKVRIVRAARAVGPRDTTLVIPILRMIESGRVTLPASSPARASFSHPKDVAQALLKSAGSSGKGIETYLVKSFDASLEEIVTGMVRESGKKAVIRKQGLLSARPPLPPYTLDQLKVGLTLSDVVGDSWKKIGYAPAYGLEKTAADIAEWYRKEPWATEDLA